MFTKKVIHQVGTLCQRVKVAEEKVKPKLCQEFQNLKINSLCIIKLKKDKVLRGLTISLDPGKKNKHLKTDFQKC